MKAKVFPKTFIEALQCFSSDPRRSRRFLNDKRLARSEKTILECFFMLRENLHQEIIAELSLITEIADPVVMAMKDLLLGITYNNLNQYPKAISLIENSLSLLKNKKLPYFEMIGELNLFVIYHNLKNEKSMRQSLAHLKQLKMTDPLSQIRILRCYFKFYSFTNNVEQAEDALDEISSLENHMSDSDAIGLLVDQFHFVVTQNKLEVARNYLTQMKKFRAFASTEDYNFMKKLLDYELDNKPIYIQDQDFINSPILFYQIKVIQYLAEANHDDAAKMWNQLRQMNLNVYGENFQYNGPVSLFTICLKRNLQQTSPEEITDPIQFLLNYEGPIRKDVLFKAFWKREAESKEDYGKLSKHLYDLKQKYGFTLKTSKGCYLVIKDQKKAA